MLASDPRPLQEIERRFVPVRLLLGSEREAVRRYGLFWTPTLLVLDPAGPARAESAGVLPADDLLAFLDWGEAHVLLRRAKFARAAELFAGIGDHWPASPLAPEGLYWAAIARFMMDHDDATLEAGRAELRRRYPDSLAARKT